MQEVSVPTPSAVGGADLVKGLQERAARALLAARVETAAGWWLRHTPGGSWWAGTVLPHGPAGPGELARRVAAAEGFHTRHGTVARFQISPGACPDGLDAFLAARGYRRECPMSLRAAAAERVVAAAHRPADAPRVRLEDRPACAWFDVWHAVHGHGGDPGAEWEMLGRVEQPSAYARALIGDEVVAVGRAVADTGWAGVFGMATLPGARGTGAAGQVLAALAGWAHAHGAGRVYLQVEPGNLPALRLYERAGFGEVCGYHYRAAR
jgi:N-acetylglutamate synthase